MVNCYNSEVFTFQQITAATFREISMRLYVEGKVRMYISNWQLITLHNMCVLVYGARTGIVCVDNINVTHESQDIES